MDGTLNLLFRSESCWASTEQVQHCMPSPVLVLVWCTCRNTSTNSDTRSVLGSIGNSKSIKKQWKATCWEYEHVFIYYLGVCLRSPTEEGRQADRQADRQTGRQTDLGGPLGEAPADFLDGLRQVMALLLEAEEETEELLTAVAHTHTHTH